MNDKELLTLAAKAAGELTPNWYGNEAYLDGLISKWNPLTSDSDALRLAVKLHLNVFIGLEGTGVNDGEIPLRSFVRASEQHKNDPFAATRRAIVRAAAEIGRGME